MNIWNEKILPVITGALEIQVHFSWDLFKQFSRHVSIEMFFGYNPLPSLSRTLHHSQKSPALTGAAWMRALKSKLC